MDTRVAPSAMAPAVVDAVPRPWRPGGGDHAGGGPLSFPTEQGVDAVDHLTSQPLGDHVFRVEAPISEATLGGGLAVPRLACNTGRARTPVAGCDVRSLGLL